VQFHSSGNLSRQLSEAQNKDARRAPEVLHSRADGTETPPRTVDWLEPYSLKHPLNIYSTFWKVSASVCIAFWVTQRSPAISLLSPFSSVLSQRGSFDSQTLQPLPPALCTCSDRSPVTSSLIHESFPSSSLSLSLSLSPASCHAFSSCCALCSVAD